MVVRAYRNQRDNLADDIINDIRLNGVDVFAAPQLPPDNRPLPLTNKQIFLYFFIGLQFTTFFTFAKALINKHYTNDCITFYNSINDIHNPVSFFYELKELIFAKKSYPHYKYNYYSAAFIALSTCSMLAFFKTQNIDAGKFSALMAFSIGFSGLKQAVFNHSYYSSAISSDVSIFGAIYLCNLFLLDLLTNVGITLIPKFIYCLSLPLLNCPNNNETPSIIDISTRVVSLLLSINATSLDSDNFLLPCIGALAMRNIVAPCLEHFVEKNEKYSKIVKASVATCAVAALFYAVDGSKMLSSINFSSLLNKGAAIAA